MEARGLPSQMRLPRADNFLHLKLKKAAPPSVSKQPMISAATVVDNVRMLLA